MISGRQRVTWTVMISDVNRFVYSARRAAGGSSIATPRRSQLLQTAWRSDSCRVLYAPRKYGKTTLLKRALRDGEARRG